MGLHPLLLYLKGGGREAKGENSELLRNQELHTLQEYIQADTT